jgi:hypothetical protein
MWHETRSPGRDTLESVFLWIVERGTWRKAQENAGKVRYDESFKFTSLTFSGISQASFILMLIYRGFLHVFHDFESISINNYRMPVRINIITLNLPWTIRALKYDRYLTFINISLASQYHYSFLIIIANNHNPQSFLYYHTLALLQSIDAFSRFHSDSLVQFSIHSLITPIQSPIVQRTSHSI